MLRALQTAALFAVFAKIGAHAAVCTSADLNAFSACVENGATSANCDDLDACKWCSVESESCKIDDGKCTCSPATEKVCLPTRLSCAFTVPLSEGTVDCGRNLTMVFEEGKCPELEFSAGNSLNSLEITAFLGFLAVLGLVM
eukprot:TRINITY_DN3158_c0_g1_i2.p2 TRINITY_DN3158_c0_g1~~TRINITY_DN3158_c0_g1_i2.p2  ORF type:complete len:142 (+),score=23.42 TRINITY_DN3158_c0_g1_i2:227-652(+)